MKAIDGPQRAFNNLQSAIHSTIQAHFELKAARWSITGRL